MIEKKFIFNILLNMGQKWLLKSEPNVWSINQQKKAGNKGAPWDGVRNYQAAKNLKAMKKGDQCFFYHKTDQSGRFVAVTVKFVKKLKTPIKLENIKKIKKLSHISLIRQSRLSVMPIDSKSWKILNNIGKV